jgi:hypothetical protein
VVAKDEQCAPVGPAEQQLQRPLRHVAPADLLAVGRVDEYPPLGDVDAPVRPLRDALAAAVGERAQVRDRPALAEQAAVDAILGLVAHEHPRTRFAVMKP